MGLVTALTARHISISSVCKRGLRLPICSTFSFCIGSITAEEIKSIESSTSPSVLSALRSAAAEAPKSVPVLPVTILPSGSSSAAHGTPVTSSFSRARPTTALSLMVR